jgi:hypothetical protein
MKKVLSFVLTLLGSAVVSGCSLEQGVDPVGAAEASRPARPFPEHPVLTNVAECATATREGRWTVARFANAAIDAAPRLAMSKNGHAAILWHHEDLGRRLWTARYVPGQSWSTPVDMSQAGHFPKSARLAVNDAGHVVAVWHDEITPTSDRIATRAYLSGPTWTGPVFFDPLAGEPDLLLDAQDVVTVATRGLNYRPTTDVAAQRYALSSGPGISRQLSSGCLSCSTPQLALLDGAALVVWNQAGAPGAGVRARRMETTAVEQLLSNGSGPTSNPRLASNSRDKAVAVWEENDSGSSQIWSASYVAESGWTLPARRSDGVSSALAPRVAVDGGGGGVAIWIQSANGAMQIYASAFFAAHGWSPPQPISEPDVSVANAEVALAPAGHGIAVWEQSDGSRARIFAARYVVGSGWRPSAPISDEKTSAATPAVAVDQCAGAFAAWRQNEGLFIARFE